MKTIDIKPGSIILWTECSKFKKLVNFLTLKKNSFNKMKIITEPTTWVILTDKIPGNAIILEWKEDFTKFDIKMLKQALTSCKEDDERLLMFNLVRPETFTLEDTNLDKLSKNTALFNIYGNK